MNREALLFLADAVLKAQQVHEESWDRSNQRYGLNHTQAAERVLFRTGVEMKDPDKRAEGLCSAIVSLLNYYAWNDVQDWAAQVNRELK